MTTAADDAAYSAERLEQHVVQRAEVDAAPGWQPADDDVGGVAEHARARSTLSVALAIATSTTTIEDDPHRPEHPAQAAQRVLEVLRPLAGNAGRVPTAGGAVLRRREIELFLVVLRDRR